MLTGRGSLAWPAHPWSRDLAYVSCQAVGWEAWQTNFGCPSPKGSVDRAAPICFPTSFSHFFLVMVHLDNAESKGALNVTCTSCFAGRNGTRKEWHEWKRKWITSVTTCSPQNHTESSNPLPHPLLIYPPLTHCFSFCYFKHFWHVTSYKGDGQGFRSFNMFREKSISIHANFLTT